MLTTFKEYLNKEYLNEEYNYDEFFDELNFFMKSDLRNKWLYTDGFKMYVRKSKRYINGDTIQFLDIASIEAKEMGTGIFTKILNQILIKYPQLNLFVEFILNDRLYNFLKKYNFKTSPSDKYSMYLIR